MKRKMRKSFLLVIGALLLVLTGAATQSEAGVNVNVGINLPAIRFAAPPDVVVIPGTYEALAKVSNVHPPQLLPSREGNTHTPTPLSRGDLPSSLVGEGKGEG